MSSRKRQDDNRQLRPEELEALEDAEPEEAGTFKRASAEELASRRRIKIKRSSDSGSSASFSAQPTGNPFANFSGMTGGAPSAPPAPANPFANFSGLSGGSTAQTSTMFSLSKPVEIPKPTAVTSSVVGTTATSSATTAVKITPEMEKMQRLNKSFLDWMNRQKLQHGLSIWKGGLQDYINYASVVNKDTDGNANSRAGDGKPSNGHKESNGPASTATKTDLSFIGSNASTVAAPTPAPINGFSFGKKQEVDIAPPAVPAFGGFSFGKKDNADITSAPASAPALAFGGFSFGKKPDEGSTDVAAQAVSSAGMFSFSAGFKPPAAFPTLAPLSATPSTFSAPVAKADTPGGGDDEEGEAILEPEKVHRNEDDNDDILHEVECKLFRFNKDEKEWRDAGKGTFRVTEDKAQKKRMLLRNMTGRIMLNAFFYKDMTFTQLGKNGIRFLLVIDDSGEPKMLMIKVKPENLEKTLTFLKTCVPK